MDNLNLDICPKCGNTHNKHFINSTKLTPSINPITWECEKCDIQWGAGCGAGIRDLKKWREAVDRNIAIYDNPPKVGPYTRTLFRLTYSVLREMMSESNHG